ncbi:MAG: energy transducer TonB [Flavisolibacter sp.]
MIVWNKKRYGISTKNIVMDAIQILQSDLLDLIFENRNKDYGAYALRRNYQRRILLSLLITGLIATSVFLGARLLKTGGATETLMNIREVVVERFRPQPKLPDLEPPAAKPVQPQVQTTRLTGFDIKPDEQVMETEVPPINEVARVDVIDREGLREDGVISVPDVVKGNGILMAPQITDDEQTIFYAVEIQASVDGKLWKRWLQNQLMIYIENAVAEGMEAGVYTVQVKFLVEIDGSIRDVRALNDPGFGLAQGAEEVIRKGPLWRAGEQNGRKVRSYHTQPINFVIAEN